MEITPKQLLDKLKIDYSHGIVKNKIIYSGKIKKFNCEISLNYGSGKYSNTMFINLLVKNKTIETNMGLMKADVIYKGNFNSGKWRYIGEKNIKKLSCG